jgi:hypothetical protein
VPLPIEMVFSDHCLSQQGKRWQMEKSKTQVKRDGCSKVNNHPQDQQLFTIVQTGNFLVMVALWSHSAGALTKHRGDTC